MWAYSEMLQRSYHKNISFGEDFGCVNGATHSSKKAFQNTQEMRRVTSQFCSGHHFAHAGVPFRGEHGFFKIAPYMLKSMGPYGRKICDSNAKTSKRIDQGFSNIYWLSEDRLPVPALVSLLSKIWSNEKIDYIIPTWLWDRRLEHFVQNHLALYNCILSKDVNSILYCQWQPIPITKHLLFAKTHKKYCSLVLRLFKLENVRSDIERKLKNLKLNSEKSLLKKEVYDLAIGKIIEWQGTMMGIIFYMSSSQHYSDEELEKDFSQSKLSTFDEGFHWTMHLGELHDVSCLMKYLPFFSPVEKRSQKQRRIRGQQTDAGSIGDMRGTFFDSDKYISSIMNVLCRGMIQPNKIRRVEAVITEPLRKLYGIVISQEAISKKKPSMKNKISEIEQLVYSISINIKLIKNGEENTEIIEDIQKNIKLLLKFKKHQILKIWKMNSENINYNKLIQDFENLLQNGNFISISKTIKDFMGSSPSSIPNIITKMKNIIQKCWEKKEYDDSNHQLLTKYCVKILSFNDYLLRKYLSKDFKGDLLKEIRTELNDIIARKWKITDDISSTMRRFLRCNNENQWEIQNEKIATILHDEDDLNNTNDNNNEYSSVVRRNKGRAPQDTIYIPSWSGSAQKKVASGEAKILNPNGGHNAHRFLDFITRIFGVSLLGGYPKSEYKPSFDTIFEIYRFIQFNYPSVEEFCTWIETILPFDVKFLYQKKETYLKSMIKEDIVVGENGEEIFSSDMIQKIYSLIDAKEGSQCRRWFIIYILREHHIFFVSQNPSLQNIVSKLYQWETITNNIYKTMDINRNVIDNVICDYKIHEKTCIVDQESKPGCKHCSRWKYVQSHFHPKLIQIYLKWPILFAIDYACQAQSDKHRFFEKDSETNENCNENENSCIVKLLNDIKEYDDIEDDHFSERMEKLFNYYLTRKIWQEDLEFQEMKEKSSLAAENFSMSKELEKEITTFNSLQENRKTKRISWKKWVIQFISKIEHLLSDKSSCLYVDIISNNQHNGKKYVNDFIIPFNHPLIFSMEKGSSASTFNGDNHTELLDYSPRPLMRTFEQNVVEQLSEIDHKFSDPFKVFEYFTTTKKRKNQEYNQLIFKLSEQAVEEYQSYSQMFSKNMQEHVESIIQIVLSRFRPNSKIGLEWMVAIFKISFKSIRMIESARQKFEQEQSRTLALKMLLKILGNNPHDFFVLQTFYNMVAHHNRIKLFPTTESIMSNTIESIKEKVKDILDPNTATLPKQLTNFYACFPHGTMQAAMVGSELGIEGEKNTRSYGNDNLTVNPYDGHVYCTISGKRMEKKDGDDISLNCTNKPNVKIDMLGRVLQLYDILYVMCEYCGNIMTLKWERMSAGGSQMWCGQCIRGQKKQAENLGYQWLSTNSLSPCTRPIFVGACPTFVQRCVICPSPKSVPETLTYYLMWIDTDSTGHAFLGYVPICNTHKRNYHMEKWEMGKLGNFTFFSQNQFKSYILLNDGRQIAGISDGKPLPPSSRLDVQNVERYFYRNTPTDEFRLNRSYCEPVSLSKFEEEEKKYLLEKQNSNEQNQQIDQLVSVERKRGRPPKNPALFTNPVTKKPRNT